MTAWTPTSLVDLKGKTPVEYRTLIDTALDIIITKLPALENELVDTRQRGLGFMTPDAKAAADEQLRRERAARYPSTTATGAPIPVGLRGFIRAQAPASMPGERPVPVNLSAVSLAGEIPLTLLHLNQRIRRHLAAAGVCHISRPLDHPDDTKAIAGETRTLTRVIASKKLLLEVLRTVEDLAQRAKNHVDGNDRVHHPRPCPHCGRRTLVVYLDAGIIRCERDPHSGEYEPCVCDDSYCDCKVRHHRHEWTRATASSKKWSWHTLARDQERAERDTTTTEGAPMPDPHPDVPRGHVLTITTTEDHTPEFPDFKWSIECANVAKCGGWQECLEEHEVDGKSAADGPWECDLDDPWNEEDEFEFHGVIHTWRYGRGWTVPFEGCVVAANDSICDDAYDIGRERGPGRYEVDDDWDDETCYLQVVAEVPKVEHHPGCNDGCDGDVHQLLGGES